jgi:hypothetical protein
MCRWIWSKEREGTAKLTERQSPERHRQREREIDGLIHRSRKQIDECR